jgi:uncharacterized protein
MLGKLAKYLRVLGLDAPCGDPDNLAVSEGSCYFLTRRTTIKGGSNVVHIRSDRARKQVTEILPLIRPSIDPDKIMSRCIACNVPLTAIQKSDAEPHVPEFVYHRYETFKTCPSCGRVYWGGSHATHMSSFIEEVLHGH